MILWRATGKKGDRYNHGKVMDGVDGQAHWKLLTNANFSGVGKKLNSPLALASLLAQRVAALEAGFSNGLWFSTSSFCSTRCSQS